MRQTLLILRISHLLWTLSLSHGLHKPKALFDCQEGFADEDVSPVVQHEDPQDDDEVSMIYQDVDPIDKKDKEKEMGHEVEEEGNFENPNLIPKTTLSQGSWRPQMMAT